MAAVCGNGFRLCWRAPSGRRPAARRHRQRVRGAKRHAGAYHARDHGDRAGDPAAHIATGNMTPSWQYGKGNPPGLFLYSGHFEFAVNKLRDRCSLSVNSIVTNAQIFWSTPCASGLRA
jgi:hypothetical protein